MKTAHWRKLSIAAIAAMAPFVAEAATVSISGSLTSFQSALSRWVDGGNGTVNDSAIGIDATLPRVQYEGGDKTYYPQSLTVSLAPGATSVQFEYTDAFGSSNANPNRVSFNAAPSANVEVGNKFKVGTLTYTNGFWYPFASIGLTITTHSTETMLDNHSFVGNIIVKVSSPDPYDPADYIANADYFYLQKTDGPLTSLGSVRVYERDNQPPGNPGNTGSVDLYAQIGSLIPTSFENPQGGVFLSASLAPITTAVPEPETYAMMLAGIGLLGFAARRKNQKSA